ncbi:MAG: serine/threonine-protein phosphatase [Candidatus Saccharibacteria bacterium]|nr:serine/threonine-protein phosphatase [Moraxellaceae bacterium]
MTVYLIDSQVDDSHARLYADVHDLVEVAISEIFTLPADTLVIADISLYLAHQWPQPTIVLAGKMQGDELAQAWQRGAWAGWIREQLPNALSDIIEQLLTQHLHQSDSRDLPAAARLQQRLIPTAIDIPNYKIEHIYKAASALSGDWLDYWITPDNRLLFYLADVAGHGAASSLLTGWLAAFHGSEHTPQALLSRMNRLLVIQNAGKHITALCGLLNPQTHHLEWCSAGHYPPPILINPDRTVETLNSSSFPLGLVTDLTLTTQTTSLQPESQMLFCSDGALEIFSGGTAEQLTQLIQALSQRTLSPPAHLSDDLTILSLHRTT